MRRFSSLFAAAALVVLAACADSSVQSPNQPEGNPGRPQFGPAQVPNPSCSPVASEDIDAALLALYQKNAWPDHNSTKGKFKNVQDLLAAGDITGAQLAAKALADFVAIKFGNLTTAEQQASQTLYDDLITDLYCYVGISGTVYDLNPGDPEKAFSVPGVGGVVFPADVVPVGTLVSLEAITGACPLTTTLDCFPGFISISLYPNTTLSQPATVVLCSPTFPPEVTDPTSVVVAHEDPTVGFEILDPAPVPSLLAGTCGSSFGQAPAPRNWLTRMLVAAADAVSPQRLEAAPYMFLGGIGGTTLRFSPFGLVSTTVIGTGGLGGKTTSFVPPALGPNAAPPSNPPLPTTYLSGGVGTNTTTGLPFVTLATQGGDANGANPIAGVTVTFSTGASTIYELDSEAKVCLANGTIPASGQVQVITDANGVATLPCLAFGDKAGFANLSATFDVSSLNFPNASLVTITAADGSTSLSSLNWLVKSDAGVAAALSVVTAPSGTAQAGEPLTQQPAFQLLDGLGNEVYASGVTVTATVTSGGGVASHTAVTTDANGVATFTDLSIGGQVAGAEQTLSFSFTGITTALTAAVQLTAGPASQLVITTQPSASAQAGEPFGTQPVVELQDQFGNTANSTAAVAASLTGGGTLAGDASVDAVGGVATFTDLQINGLVGDRTLTFTSGSLTSSATVTIVLGAGPATQLVITTQPSSTAQAGIAFGTQPVVAIRDQFNNQVSSTATVTATIATGAGAIAGGTSVSAAGGVATFASLRIDGVNGDRTIEFASAGLTSATSGTVAITAGTATSIQTYINGVAAQTYSYGTGLTAYTNVNPAPQVLVTDAWGNPVGNQPVYWNASTSNGGVLTQGAAATPTSAAGTAVVASWALGDGLNNATASLTSLGSLLDAQFTASTPTGISIFACSAGTGTSKTDLGPLSIKAPNGTTKEVTIWMSITGQSSSLASYPATFEARLNGPTGTLLKTTSGNVQLPGDNGNPVPVTFSFPTSIAKQSASSTIWFNLAITAPATRKPQVWYRNATYKSNELCYDSKAYAPGSTTVFKRGLSINVTN